MPQASDLEVILQALLDAQPKTVRFDSQFDIGLQYKGAARQAMARKLERAYWKAIEDAREALEQRRNPA